MANIMAAFRACTHSAKGTSCTHGSIHAGVLAELIAEGTGGDAQTVVRSTLTGDTWRVNPNVIQLVDLDNPDNYDVVADLAYNCRCPEVSR
jgi:hypothetical protein